jgi:hypothetical protein
LKHYNLTAALSATRANKMKTYIYFYDGTPITKAEFLSVVPKSWESEVVDGEYSWGYYRAVEIETEEN